MMMKKSMADMQKNLAAVKERLAGAAGRPGLPGRPGLGSPPIPPGLGSPPVKPPFMPAPTKSPFSLLQSGSMPSAIPLKPQPQQQMFARNPSGMQFTNQSPPPQSNSGTYMYGMKKGGKVKSKKMMDGGMAYSKGGSASSRADGIARKGKTKGKMV